MTIQELLSAAEQLSLSDQVQLASQLMQTAIQKLQTSASEPLPPAKTKELASDQQIAQASKQSSFEIFQELGLVGCIKEADPHLSRNYKSLVHQEMEDRHNRDRQ